MKDRHDDSLPLSVDEVAFVEKISRDYAPPPLEPARRAALDAALQERLAGPRGGSVLQPALASVVVGLALAFVWLLGVLEPETPERERYRMAVAEWAAEDAWERELLDLESFEAGGRSDELNELPDDYAAIAGIFLDG